MSDTQINLTIDGPVATVCLSTEGGLNVLSAGVLERLGEVAAAVKNAPGVRVLLLTATGKVFVAGANIKELVHLDPAGAAALSQKGNRVMDAIADLPCVTIARVHGAALGGGFELAMACDFRIAIATAKIGLPETSLGLIPGWNGIGRMLALAGPITTKRLVFSAAAIDAAKARDLGLVDDVAADERELDAKIGDLKKQFERAAPNGIAMAKQAIRTGDQVKAFADCFAHADAKEGMAAFIEKRKPSWVQG